tara:strand:+ start:1150 stop:1365 length:216 start_codon:yes stop_codon:yes gene_type:complete
LTFECAGWGVNWAPGEILFFSLFFPGFPVFGAVMQRAHLLSIGAGGDCFFFSAFFAVPFIGTFCRELAPKP